MPIIRGRTRLLNGSILIFLVVDSLESKELVIYMLQFGGFHDTMSMFGNKTLLNSNYACMIANDILILITEIRPLVGDTNMI